MENNETKNINENTLENERVGWYLAKATPFHEKSAIEWLRKIASDEGCENDIIEYFIPQVNKKPNSDSENKNTKQGESMTSFMIGYFAVKLNLSSGIENILYKIQRSISTKYKIIIFRDRKMTEKEMEKMRNSSKLVNMSEFALYNPGDEVIITHDSFQNMTGIIESVCEKTMKANITLHILGRNVSLEIELSKIKKKK